MAEKKILDDCKDSVQATDNDVNDILDRKIPENRNGKCLLACAHEKVGIVWFNNISILKIVNNNWWTLSISLQITDGKFSIDGMKALGAKELEKDPKALGILNEMISDCESVSDPDICEQSMKMMECMIEAGLKRGIDPKKGIQESIGSI